MNENNAFVGQTHQPSPQEVASVLGSAAPIWDELLNWLKDEQKIEDREWSSYSPKYGWALRVKLKKRNILYMMPCKGCFGVSFILGDRAVKAAHVSHLPKAVLKNLDEATKYPEGTGLRLTVSKLSDLPAIRKLTLVKLAN